MGIDESIHKRNVTHWFFLLVCDATITVIRFELHKSILAKSVESSGIAGKSDKGT